MSTGYSGQFGGAAGGNINYITKSGSNEFHGNAQYYWNGRVFNANDWFNNAFGNPRPFDIANQWAGSLGGPIKKDKLFFFFDTEGLRLLIPQFFRVLIPSPQFEAATIANIDSDQRFGPTSASRCVLQENFQSLQRRARSKFRYSRRRPSDDPIGCTGFSDLEDRIGHDRALRPAFLRQLAAVQVKIRSRLAAWTGTWARATVPFSDFSTIVGASAVYTIPSVRYSTLISTSLGGKARLIETHTFGSSAASQFLVAGSYFAPIYEAEESFPGAVRIPNYPEFQSSPGTFTSLGGGDNITLFGFGRYNTQYQLSEDVVKTRGNHKFGFGASFARIYWSESAQQINAHWSADARRRSTRFIRVAWTRPPQRLILRQLAQSFTSQIKSADLLSELRALRPGRVACTAEPDADALPFARNIIPIPSCQTAALPGSPDRLNPSAMTPTSPTIRRS